MGELFSRRPTRLPSYNYSENGIYFLTLCAKDKKKLFSEVVGGGVLDAPKINLTPIGTIVEKYIHSINNAKNIYVEKYVIMPNHIHMLIYVDNIEGTSRT